MRPASVAATGADDDGDVAAKGAAVGDGVAVKDTADDGGSDDGAGGGGGNIVLPGSTCSTKPVTENPTSQPPRGSTLPK